jgi:hypothetical protein
MSDTPERIWLGQNMNGWIAIGYRPNWVQLQEYIRADRIEALQSEVESFRTAAALAGPALQRALREIEALIAERDGLIQTGAALCDDCGWSMRFPDCGCVYCGFHRLEAERDALSALPAVQPRVKPLVWCERNEHDDATDRAGSMGQEYSVGYDDNGAWYAHSETLGMDLANAPTRDAAKAAAQAHYEARILSALEPAVRPDAAAIRGAAPRRASGPIDPEAGFATSGAEARWIGDVDAGVYDDDPEEIGILQARLEDQDRTIADLTRQLQGQPRRQSDAVAGAADYSALREAIRNMVQRYEICGEAVAGAAPVSVGPTLPRCECGMTGPCAWAECRSPNLAQKGDSHE